MFAKNSDGNLDSDAASTLAAVEAIPLTTGKLAASKAEIIAAYDAAEGDKRDLIESIINDEAGSLIDFLDIADEAVVKKVADRLNAALPKP